jgi:hypothetical protein
LNYSQKLDLYLATRERPDFRKLVEDLLNVVLTTYNNHLIDPAKPITGSSSLSQLFPQ